MPFVAQRFLFPVHPSSTDLTIQQLFACRVFTPPGIVCYISFLTFAGIVASK